MSDPLVIPKVPTEEEANKTAAKFRAAGCDPVTVEKQADDTYTVTANNCPEATKPDAD